MNYIDKFYKIGLEYDGRMADIDIKYDIREICEKLYITDYKIYKPNNYFDDDKKRILLKNVKLGEPIHLDLLCYKLVYIRNCHLYLEGIEVQEIAGNIYDNTEGFYFKTDSFEEKKMFCGMLNKKIEEIERMIELYGNNE